MVIQLMADDHQAQLMQSVFAKQLGNFGQVFSHLCVYFPCFTENKRTYGPEEARLV